jgi:hypothetical protein
VLCQSGGAQTNLWHSDVVRVVVIVVLISNIHLLTINANDVPNSFACHFVALFRSFLAWLSIGSLVPRMGGFWKRSSATCLEHPTLAWFEEEVGYFEQSDRNAFVSRVQGVIES